MNKTEILVICRHEGILATVVRLVNNNVEWNATAAATDDEAVTLFRGHIFQLVLLGSGIEQESEDKLRSVFTAERPGIIIVQHYGGGSGLLTAEICEALNGAH
jgi:hypothetical protein